jgi:acetyl esterase
MTNGQTIEAGFRLLLDMLSKAAGMAPGTVVQQRDSFKKLCAMTDRRGPASVSATELYVPGGADDRPARLYTPASASAYGPGLLFFHGGGFMLGDLDTHDALCRRIAEAAGIRVLAVDYRLAPENPFPAAHDDALAASLWLRDNGGAIGIDPDRFAIGGDSAGGNLAACTAIALRDLGGLPPKLQVLLYPGFNAEGTASLREFGDGFFLTANAIAEFSKITGVPTDGPLLRRISPDRFADLAGLPPAFVSTGGLDPLRDCGRRYADKMRAAGVAVTYRNYPGFIHGFYTMAGMSAGVAGAIADLAAELRRL